jgi:hypothetical protein
MRYIITESQLNFLTESEHLSWVKRRATKTQMLPFIHKAEQEFPMMCDDFIHEYDYAFAVINWAVNEFLNINEEMFLDERYDEISDILTNMCKEWFSEYLFDIYRETCPNENVN